MASRYWIKFYIEALDDPKVARLPDNLWRRYYECCLLAGDVSEDGMLPPINNTAWRLRVDEDTLTTEFDQLARYGLLDYRVENPLDDNCWFVTNFSKRQAAFSGAERVANFRQTEKKREYYGTGNEDVTVRYTEKEKEKEIEKEEEEEGDITPFRKLSTHFVNMTHIPELSGGAPRWVDTIKKWVAAGIVEADLESAYKILRDKDYSVTGPWSLTNTAVSEMSKRKSDTTTTEADWAKVEEEMEDERVRNTYLSR